MKLFLMLFLAFTSMAFSSTKRTVEVNSELGICYIDNEGTLDARGCNDFEAEEVSKEVVSLQSGNVDNDEPQYSGKIQKRLLIDSTLYLVEVLFEMNFYGGEDLGQKDFVAYLTITDTQNLKNTTTTTLVIEKFSPNQSLNLHTRLVAQGKENKNPYIKIKLGKLKY